MKLPADVSADRVIRALGRLGYRVMRQKGRVARVLGRQFYHHTRVPRVSILRPGRPRKPTSHYPAGCPILSASLALRVGRPSPSQPCVVRFNPFLHKFEEGSRVQQQFLRLSRGCYRRAV